MELTLSVISERGIRKDSLNRITLPADVSYEYFRTKLFDYGRIELYPRRLIDPTVSGIFCGGWTKRYRASRRASWARLRISKSSRRWWPGWIRGGTGRQLGVAVRICRSASGGARVAGTSAPGKVFVECANRQVDDSQRTCMLLVPALNSRLTWGARADSLEDFHLQVMAHAGHTNANAGCQTWHPALGSCNCLTLLTRYGVHWGSPSGTPAVAASSP